MVYAVFKALSEKEFGSAITSWNQEAKSGILSINDWSILDGYSDKEEFFVALKKYLPQFSHGSPKVVVRYVPIQEILRKPELSAQKVTHENIQKRDGQEIVGSIYNWLEEYRQYGSDSFHSSVERMQYLLKSPNGKKLSGEDRDRLGVILKAHDERGELPIDPKTNQIAFDHVTSSFALVENHSNNSVQEVKQRAQEKEALDLSHTHNPVQQSQQSDNIVDLKNLPNSGDNAHT